MQPRQDNDQAFPPSVLDQVRKGTVYTPPEVVKYICEEVLRAYKRENPTVGHDGDSIKVLDMACGTGEFLLGMAIALLDVAMHSPTFPGCGRGERDVKADIVATSLFGIDIDGSAIDIARKRLSQWCTADRIAPLDEHLVSRDYFDNDPCKFGTRKFDIIVGNPPYLFKRGLQFDGLGYGAYFKDSIARMYPVTVNGKARQGGKFNTFGLFMARSLEWLRPGGIFGCIVPNTLLRATTNETVRRLLVERARILQITDMGSGVFKNMITSTIVLILQNSLPSHSPVASVEIRCKPPGSPAGKVETHHVNQSSFSKNTSCVFNIHVDSNFSSLFEAMEKDATPLGFYCKSIIEGIVTRKADGLFVNDPNIPLSKRLLRGRDIGRYRVNWQDGSYIVYDREKLHRPRPSWVHEAPVKLVCQRIGGRPFPLRVAVDTRQHYIFASTNAIILDASKVARDVELYYYFLLGILNSKLVNAFYLLNFSNNSSLTVNVGKTFLERIPVKNAPDDAVECIGTVAKLLSLMNEASILRENANHVVRFLDATVMDCLVQELYTTSPDEYALLPEVHDMIPRESIFCANSPPDLETCSALLARLNGSSSPIPRFLEAIQLNKWHRALDEIMGL